MPGSCFPVEIVYSLGDHLENYADAAIDVVLDIHQNQPAGMSIHLRTEFAISIPPLHLCSSGSTAEVRTNFFRPVVWCSKHTWTCILNEDLQHG